jgi:hypothetical protein
MFGPRSKAFFLTVICLSIIGPILVMFWNVQLGGLLFLVGLLLAARCIGLVRSIQMEGAVQDGVALSARQNRGRTIFVQLVDDHGNALPADVVQARLAAAHQNAGPRDTVIGVHRKVD